MVSEHTSCAVGAPPSALIERDQKQAAQYRCQICRNDSHTTEEHLHPTLALAKLLEALRELVAKTVVREVWAAIAAQKK